MIRPMNAQNTVEFTLAFNRGANGCDLVNEGQKCLWNSRVKGLASNRFSGERFTRWSSVRDCPDHC